MFLFKLYRISIFSLMLWTGSTVHADTKSIVDAGFLVAQKEGRVLAYEMKGVSAEELYKHLKFEEEVRSLGHVKSGKNIQCDKQVADAGDKDKYRCLVFLEFDPVAEKFSGKTVKVPQAN